MVTNTNFIDVGSVTEFVRRPRRIQVSGRNVAVFEQDGRFFAIDANCYHSSGPLEEVRSQSGYTFFLSTWAT